MSAKHTPGPWKIGKGSFVIADSPAPGIRGSDMIEYYGGHLICESVSEENAYLIAAAPDLLESLEGIVSASTDKWETSYADFKEQFMPWAQNVAKTAIAKAKGETK